MCNIIFTIKFWNYLKKTVIPIPTRAPRGPREVRTLSGPTSGPVHGKSKNFFFFLKSGPSPDFFFLIHGFHSYYKKICFPFFHLHIFCFPFIHLPIFPPFQCSVFHILKFLSIVWQHED